jgi:putative PIN family toxin of toxin-antitoxin system
VKATWRVVLDTNVLVAALRSKRGAANRLLDRVDSGTFEVCLSVPLLFEYEAVCKRLIGVVPVDEATIDAVLNYLSRIAVRTPVYFLWRPFLRDPQDDMVLELAIAGSCDAIVTFNVSDFAGAEQLGVRVLKPKEFLQMIGEWP